MPSIVTVNKPGFCEASIEFSMPPHVLLDQLIDHTPRDNLVPACCIDRNGSGPAVDRACEFHKCLNGQNLRRLKFGECWVVCSSAHRRIDVWTFGVRKRQASFDKLSLFAAQSSEVGHFKKSTDHPAVRLIEPKFSNSGRDFIVLTDRPNPAWRLRNVTARNTNTRTSQVNLKTAKVLGPMVPDKLLALADGSS